MLPTEPEILTSIVARVMRIEEITHGDGKKGYFLRYRGRLYQEDTSAAYDQLAAALRPAAIHAAFPQGERPARLSC